MEVIHVDGGLEICKKIRVANLGKLIAEDIVLQAIKCGQ